MSIRGIFGNAALAIGCVLVFMKCNVYHDDFDRNAGVAERGMNSFVTSSSPADSGKSSDSGAERAGEGSAMLDTATYATSGAGGGDGDAQIKSQDDGNAAAADNASTDKCGDGLRSANERCDVSIASGKPGACPTRDEDCPLGDGCTTWVFNKQTDCTADCVQWERLCINGDGCCPTACTGDNDSDCTS